MSNEAASSESEMSPTETSEESEQGDSTESAENGSGSSEGASDSASGQGESAGQSAGEGQGDSEQASGEGAEGSQGQGSESQGEAQGKDSDAQGKGQGQGAAQGERDSSSGKPEQPRSDLQPSGSGGSASGGSGEGAASSPSENGEGTGSQPSESLGEGSGSSWRAATVGQARQAIDALERDLRQGQIDSELLDELGWDISTAQRFVESYKRSTNRPPPVTDDTATRPAPGRAQAAASPHSPERVLRAVGKSAPGVGGLYDTGTRPADDTRELMQPGQQRVPARYEPILKAYYETLTSQPAQ